MNLRKMLKVSLLMLLAMALAATSAHARLDLFGQLLTFKNKPKPNSDEYSGTIPYTECINTCDVCFCTLKWPPESNMCICVNNKKPAAPVQQVESSSSKVKSKIMPYSECTEKCKYVCACTPIWPPELSTCICSDFIESVTTKAADEVEELHKELDLLSKPLERPGGGFMPYPECIKKCGECTTCTKVYPIEKAWCYCDKSTTSNSNKPAIQNSDEVEELHKELDLLSKPLKRPGGGFMPYPECIKKCGECTTCTKVYPIEKAWCYCDKSTTSNSNKPAIQNSDEVEELHKELDLLSKRLERPGGGFMPYPECIKKCGECTTCTKVYPIEKAWCYCDKSTTSNSNRPAIQNSEGVLQVLVKGKGKSNVDNEPSGAIPYTECINTCDLCFCTRKWPPESNTCICGDNSKSKKLTGAVQKVESSSSIVKSKVLPYTKCIKTCKHLCACTLIYPPELSTCICSDPIESTAAKAVGR